MPTPEIGVFQFPGDDNLSTIEIPYAIQDLVKPADYSDLPGLKKRIEAEGDIFTDIDPSQAGINKGQIVLTDLDAVEVK